MGHKQSKNRASVSVSREGSTGSFSDTNSTDGGEYTKKQKKQSRLRRLTRALTKKSSKSTQQQQKDQPDNTYAHSLQVTLKKTNSDTAIAQPNEPTRKNNTGLSPLHSQSVTPISFSPRSKAGQEAFASLARSETLSTPYASAAYNSTNNHPTHNNDHGAQDEHEQGAQEEYVPDGADYVPPPSEEDGKAPKVRRATTTSSFLKFETGGGRAANMPKRMSRAFVFHQQIAAKEMADRGAELNKIMQQEKPVCDIFEENPFKKGFCRVCKHLKTVHKDPYSDILDELEDF